MNKNSQHKLAKLPAAIIFVSLAILEGVQATTVFGQFDLQITINKPFFVNERRAALIEEAVATAEAFWETVIIDYQPEVESRTFPFTVSPLASLGGALGGGNYTATMTAGDFVFATGGQLWIAVDQIDDITNYPGPGIPESIGRNFLDDVVAHEIGHALGFGTLWMENQLYADDFRYVGAHGLAAYRKEFDPTATFVPVENAGGPGSAGAHWDQIFRRTEEEGNPDDPTSLSPFLGIRDAYGRDLALDLMTAALDPDYGGDFLSLTTIASMRDLGYVVADAADFNGDGTVDLQDRAILDANFGATGLRIDSIRFGDANRDRTVDAVDLALWQQAVPEPSTGMLLAAAAVGVLLWRPRC